MKVRVIICALIICWIAGCAVRSGDARGTVTTYAHTFAKAGALLQNHDNEYAHCAGDHPGSLPGLSALSSKLSSGDDTKMSFPMADGYDTGIVNRQFRQIFKAIFSPPDRPAKPALSLLHRLNI